MGHRPGLRSKTMRQPAGSPEPFPADPGCARFRARPTLGRRTEIGIAQWTIIQAVASSLGVELSPVNLRDAEIEHAAIAFARGSNGGLIVVVSAASLIHRELIVTLAARYQLPSVYPYSSADAARPRRRGDRIVLLRCMSPVLMLWTAPPRARECHGSGGC